MLMSMASVGCRLSLRLDGAASRAMHSDNLACVASLGGSLLQLALLGVVMDTVPLQALSSMRRDLLRVRQTHHTMIAQSFPCISRVRVA